MVALTSTASPKGPLPAQKPETCQSWSLTGKSGRRVRSRGLTGKLIVRRGEVARIVVQVLAPPVLNSYLGSLGGRPGRPRPRPGERVGACGCCWWRRVRVGLRRHVKTRVRGTEPVTSWGIFGRGQRS